MLGAMLAYRRKRGNPNWGKPIPLGPHSPTEFEVEVKRLRLKKETYAFSNELQGWCKKNKNRVYIPEWLLQKWEIEVDVRFDWAA